MRQTDTIRRLQRDDLATQAVLRYQSDHTLLDGDIQSVPALRMLQELAVETLLQEHRPRSVAEWIALVLFAADTPAVLELRRAAREDADAVYIHAERWLEIIDAQHTLREARGGPDDRDHNNTTQGDDDGR